MRNLGVVRLQLALLLAGLISGCDSLYMHDSAVDQSMTSARAGLDNAKINDVFDRQSKYFDQLQTEEISTVTARDAAQRDGQVALFLIGNETVNGGSLMLNDIDMRILMLYGQPDSDSEHPLWRTIDDLTISSRISSDVKDSYNLAVKKYIALNGSCHIECTSVLAEPSCADSASFDVKEQYGYIVQSCKDAKSLLDADSAQALRKLPATLPTQKDGKANAQSLIAQNSFQFSQNYFAAQKRLQDIQSELQNKQKDAKDLQIELDKAQKALEQSLATGTTTQQQVNDLIKKIHDALSEVGTYSGNPYAKKVVSAKLAAEIQNIIDATGTPAPPATGNPVVPSATTALATATTLNTAVTAAATSPPQPDTARASLALFQAVAGVGDAFSNPPRVPHPNVLAIGRAQMSYSRDVANAEVADLEAQVDAARSQLNAITTAVYMLSRAKTELQIANLSLKPKQGLTDFLADPKTTHEEYRHTTAALFYYVSAWNRGEILADEIDVERSIAARRATMERSRRAAQAWVETIKPGLDTLVGFGNGGIDPKTVAQIMGGVGLVATGIGVNK